MPARSDRLELTNTQRGGWQVVARPGDLLPRSPGAGTLRLMSQTEQLPPYSEHARHWLLSPNVCFLNHGSFGACPIPVLARQHEWRELLERQPVRFFQRRLEEQLDVVRAELAEFIGAQPEDLALIPNATTGVNTVLASLRAEPGDEWLVSDQEYNASANALRYWAQRAGASVRVVPLPFPVKASEDIVTALCDAVGEHTRLCLIDHVTSQTGMVLPVERIVPALKQRGAECLIDGAHALGMLPLELDALGAAYYTSNAHKWLCAPKGAAFLHVRRDRQAQLRPLEISHGANSPRTDRSRFQLEFGWKGTDDPTAWLVIPHAIRFLRGLFAGGFAQLRAHNRDLVLTARRELCRVLEIDAPCPEEMIGSLAAVPIWSRGKAERPTEPLFIDPLQEELYRRRIEVPVQSWPAAPSRVLRVSGQAYNAPLQYSFLARELQQLRELTLAS